MTEHKSSNKESSSPLFRRGLGKASYKYIAVSYDGSIVRVELNRPERHNALILELISELDLALDEIAARTDLHFLILSGKGRSFCAGADMNWFYGSDERTVEESTLQYKQLADLLLKLYQLPQITIAVVRGNVFGGGIGLMAACDFVLGDAKTRFMFSEVKLGLLPATILPFVAKRLSVQNLRKWVLTGNMFGVDEANQAGLVDVLYDESRLEAVLYGFISLFEAASPNAVKKGKLLINQVVSGAIDVTDTAVTAGILAGALSQPDGQEGIRAFLEKRKPEWKSNQSQ